MTQQNKDFCFCTLALGGKYRQLAKQLANDLAKYSPGHSLLVLTDDPKDFSSVPNVLAYKYHKQGILHCYHDRRFALEKALSLFPAAVHLDADTRIVSQVPEIKQSPGFTARFEDLVEHVTKYSPERLELIKTVASKLNIPLENTRYIGESVYVFSRDEGREKEFIKYWGMIGRYLELHGMHAGDGNAMGLAAAKAGVKLTNDGWTELRKITKHLDASHEKTYQTSWQKWQRRLVYHYRLNRARLMALQDFNFYYR